MLTLLSVDERLLLRYMKWSNFRGMPFDVEIEPSCLKYMNCFIWVKIDVNASWLPVPDLAWACVFTRNTRSFTHLEDLPEENESTNSAVDSSHRLKWF